LQKADLVLADSQLLSLVWRLVSRRQLNKISGLSYLLCLLKHEEVCRNEKLFLIVLSEAAKSKAMIWQRQKGFAIESDDCSVVDAGAHPQEHALLLEIQKSRPRHVIIALAGTGQERLALYLRDFLLYRPAIHRVGAALGFLTGSEHPIREWGSGFLPVGSGDCLRSHALSSRGCRAGCNCRG
jgi:hypothetical protein